MSVDLPTPDEPTSTDVLRGTSRSRTASSPSPSRALVVSTVAPSASASTRARTASGSADRSLLFSSTIGVAPLSQTVTR